MKIYKVLCWLIVIAFAGLFLYLQSLQYEDCIRLISDLSGYSKTDKISSLLTVAKFNMLKFAPVAGIVAGILMLLFRKPILKGVFFIARNIHDAYKYLIHTFKGFSKGEKIMFWGLVVVNVFVKLYYAWHFPITYDEAWTYLNFTNRGIISSMTYYSAPNNHILNSILTNIFNHLPLPATIRIRLPAVLTGIFFLIVFYAFARRWMNKRVAILLLFILSFLTPELFYGFTARGYMMVILFSTICYFISIRLTETAANETRNLFYFSLCAILGFYAMPSFLYPYATLNIYLFVFALLNKRLVFARKLLLWGMITVIAVVVLYIPVFAISGINSVIGNQYVIPISRREVLQRLWPHLLDVFEYLFIYRYAIFIVYGILILSVFYSSNRRIAVLSLWIVGFMVVIPILHSVLPFTRTWVYLTVPVLISTGLILQKLLPASISSIAYYAAGVCLSVIILISSDTSIKGIEQYALNAKKATDFTLKKQAASVFVNEPLMDTYLLYYFKVNNQPLDCIIFEKDFLDKQKEVRYIIEKKGNSASYTAGQPVFSNAYFDIYKNPSYINGIKP